MTDLPPMNAHLEEHAWAFLDHARGVFADKAVGLDAAGLAHRMQPTSMTLGGLLSHLAYVEDYWLHHRFAGNPPSQLWAGVDWTADNDFDWHLAAGATPEELRARWEESLSRSRAAVAGAAWGQLCALPGRSGHTPDLGWVVLHLIEEYSRHNGHADLLRESYDGSVG